MASPVTKIALTIILCLLYIAYSVFSSRLFLKQVADHYKNGHVITPRVDVNHNHNDTNDASMMGAVKEQFDAKEDKEKEEEKKDDGDLLLIEEYRTKRGEQFYSWFEGHTTNRLLPNVDANGTILDFVIAGFAKCGTTSIEGNLGNIAPMPIADVCTPIHQIVYYSYKNWPKEYNIRNGTEVNKILRGTKCPRLVNYLDEISTYLPKTLVIVGMRHPVMFFQSYWNMLADNENPSNPSGKSPYDFTNICPNKSCVMECPNGQLICMHRTRFHLALAKIGKTLLSDVERQLLAPDDRDGGDKLLNHHIQNPIFLYEMSELNEDYLWNELATTLKVPEIPHDMHLNDKKDRQPGKDRINICDAEYDAFRAMIMPHAYNMSIWFCDYLVPIAKNESRNDVIIANPDRFCEIVKDYAYDPCHRLIRMSNGTYTVG